MYFVTVIRGNEKLNMVCDSRCFGYFKEMPDIEGGNFESLQECYYNYLVVEKIEEGIYVTAEQVAWYEYIKEPETPFRGWRKVETPECAKSIFNFAIG